MDLLKLKMPALQRNTVNRKKTQAKNMGENICKRYMLTRPLSKLCKELKLNDKKNKQIHLKIVEKGDFISPKKYTDDKKHMKKDTHIICLQ